MAAHSNAIVVLDNTGMEMINRVPERHGVSAEAAEAGIKMLEDFLKSMDRVRRKVAPAAAKKPAAKKPAAKEGEILLPSSDCPGWQRSRIGKNYYITAPLCLGGQRFDRQSKLESFLLESGIEENISLREPRVSAALKTTATPAFGGFGLSTATSASTGSTAAPTLNFGAAATSTTAAGAPSLNFGASAPATTTAASTGFSLSGGAASTGFSLGGASSASATSSSTGGFSLGGGVTTTTAASGGLSLGGITAAAAASSTGLTSVAAPTGGLGLGAASTASTGLNFGGFTSSATTSSTGEIMI